MAYIGTPPPTGFSATSKQSFSGDASTVAFSLTKAVALATDLEVFVDNVQQEPTTAYTVSSTTLTFTAAPATGTNNIYVVHRNGHADNGLLPPQDLGTTDYIFGDDVSFNSDGAVINFGADSEVNLTHVADTGLQLNSTNKLMFGDSASFIQQSSDGVLRIDGETTIDINGALVVDGGVVFNDDSADVDFRVESNGEANMLLVDGGNDRVVISKSSSGATTFPLVLSNPPGNAANTAVGLRFVPTNATIGDRTVDIIGGQTSAGGNAMELKFLVSNGGTAAEQMRIHAGGVVSFNNGIELGSGLDATAANTLDDYEEGTFTPALDSSNSDFSSLGYSHQNGFYTKVGRMVHAHAQIIVNTTPSGSSGDLRVTGFPFAASSSAQHLGRVGFYNNFTAQTDQSSVSIDIDGAATFATVRFQEFNSASGYNAVGSDALHGASRRLTVQISYFV